MQHLDEKFRKRDLPDIFPLAMFLSNRKSYTTAYLEVIVLSQKFQSICEICMHTTPFPTSDPSRVRTDMWKYLLRANFTFSNNSFRNRNRSIIVIRPRQSSRIIKSLWWKKLFIHNTYAFKRHSIEVALKDVIACEPTIKVFMLAG
ncbi:hypothetical protein TNCT_535101 [Trichonephila clavata]|uniref:Uncharacterized protein n=1 Tax=Trichonephila clavata TaxID=2740835 RepID=A0A8X6LKR7_TRICU|nr:hypothetical protein TNCT_535101 [Trichonephila clavata]